jgi:hypothetical protein
MAGAGGRAPGFRHNEDTRQKIKVSLLINRLMEHINEPAPGILDNSQVNSIKILLNKAIPDLKAVEHTGQDGGPLQVNIMRFGADDAKPAQDK